MEITVKEKIAKILDLSQQFQPLFDDDDKVVSLLNKLTDDQLIPIQKRLEKTNQEKINKIRLKVVNFLLEKGNIDHKEIEAIKSDVNNQYEGNILLAWGSYFKLFLPFIYRVKIKEDLDEIAAKIVESLKLTEIIKYKVVDFDGASNFGTDHVWIAIYNKKQPSQKYCWQLYIGFKGENVEYGLLRNLDKGPDREAKLDKVSITTFDFNQMISYLDESKNRIIEDDKPIRYWKFSPGKEACFWQEMQNKHIASIGWGDYKFAGKNKSEITKLHSTYFDDHKIDAFTIQAFNQAQVGDIVFAFEGRKKILGYGVINETSKYSQEVIIPKSDHHNYLEVDWVILEQPIIMKNMVAMVTFSDISERRMELDKIMVSRVDTSRNETTEPKTNPASVNQILYGPPGTGKTFKTVLEALKILDDLDDDTELTYSEQKELYDNYKAKGQIEFVTFHQSFSYEDFVEGIRAETNNEGNISYSVKDGVFKKLAIEALFSKYETENLPDEEAIKKARLRVDDDDNQQGESEFDYEHKKSLLSDPNRPAFVRDTGKPFILIIDEINRGNTSRIFGELITLIEDTKRAGTDEAMTALLPYSQETFTVPDNLYIIGTMNTADRSLALIDTALRRRFDFIEMMPKTSLIIGNDGQPLIIDGIKIQDMLKTINERIEALYDREHTIGHAFFMKLKDKPTINELASIFRNKILPLLEEYFFEDWEKITQVLGKSGIYKDETLTEIQLGFKPSGKNYSRNDDKLAKAQTYINIYSTDPVQQD
jgi:5-methylcytosine-specific restriction protein B